MSRRSDIRAVLLVVAAWALVAALVGVGGDYALNDDWAYAASARHLVRTGELRILEWAAPSLVTHVLWGAGALRLLGESYVSLRCGTLAWALAALLAVYGLGRTLGLGPWASAVAALALGLSPWFVNLSFTYMTDVPWLALMLLAMITFARALHPRGAEPPRVGLLVLSGALVGAAALSRQFALITAPAFAAVLAIDARGRHGAAFRWPAVRGCLLFGGPVAALFFPFQIWYTRVHGLTQANREAFGRIFAVRPVHLLDHLTSVLHYAGLWLFPLALALLLARRLDAVVTRRQAAIALVVFGGSALRMFLKDPSLAGMTHPDASIHPLMPYLGNVFFLVGLGPPTVSDVFWGNAPLPHAAAWLGVPLTLASTLGGVAGAGLLAATIQRIRRAPPGEEDGRPGLVRALLAGVAGTYLLWHLSTATFLFDRYLLPLLPIVVLLGIDAAPPHLARSPVVLACLLASGLAATALTREYLSWNDARDRAVRTLHARGVPAAAVDAGFEPNGPVHFAEFLRRTGQLLESGSFWIAGAPYRISFWPARAPECSTEERYPYWTWPGGGDRAVYVLHCRPPAADARP